MKEQYVGDVSDYRKYALLRALSQSGTIKVGVCWMLTLPDTRSVSIGAGTGPLIGAQKGPRLG